MIMTENVIQPKRSRGRLKKYHNDENKRLAYNRQIKQCMLRNPFHCDICNSRPTIPRLDSVTYFRPGSCGGKISFKFSDKKSKLFHLNCS